MPEAQPKFMILDLETESHEFFGDLASPFDPRNYIVAPAFALDNGPVQDWYFTSREEADASNWFKVPDSVQYIVAHNATFELVWLLHRHREELEKFLRRGGRVICTQLAEYLLTNQQTLYPNLNDTAQLYGGTPKIDAVKLLWERGHLTSEIDKALLLEYLSGPGGDIENTRRVIFGQIPKLVERGMWRMYLDRCDALLYSAYCKFFGMKVDMPLAEETTHAFEKETQQKLLDLRAYLPEMAGLRYEYPDGVGLTEGLSAASLHSQFNFGSDFHLSALLFGGPIKLETQVHYSPEQYVKDDFYKMDSGYRITVAEHERLKAEGAYDGTEPICYKSGKNKGLPKVFREDTEQVKLKKGSVIVHFPGLVRFDELPPDVAEQFTGKRAEFRGKRYLCDRRVIKDDAGDVLEVLVPGTPVYSTSSEVMELLVTHCKGKARDFAGKVSDLSDQLKIYGTYFLGLFAKNVMPDGMLRAVINHTSTKTGRLSSKLQQMPRVETTEDLLNGAEHMTYGSRVKECLTTRFENGNVIECDYTALEVVHLATLSGDKALLGYLQNGTDMHCLRLAAKLHSDYETVKAIVKDGDHPEHNRYKNLRQGIKPLSFQ